MLHAVQMVAYALQYLLLVLALSAPSLSSGGCIRGEPNPKIERCLLENVNNRFVREILKPRVQKRRGFGSLTESGRNNKISKLQSFFHDFIRNIERTYH